MFAVCTNKKCRVRQAVPSSAVGKKIRCRRCGEEFVVRKPYIMQFKEARAHKIKQKKMVRTTQCKIESEHSVIGSALFLLGMLLISPFYVIWVIVKAMWAASESSLDVSSGRLSGSYSGDSIEEGGIDMPGGSSYASEAKEDSSRCRQYWDSNGRCVGYRDEMGWVHAEDGRSFIGKIDDDGTFYDSSGNYRGQIEEGGAIWVDGKGFVGFQDGDTYSEEGHAGIPDIYEEGGDGTGGAFQSLLG